MANRGIKRYSTSLTIREMQIKTTMRCYFMPVKMTVINKSTNKGWQGCGEREPLYTFGGNAGWCSRCGKQYEVTSKN